jgi:hypothetical protein
MASAPSPVVHWLDQRGIQWEVAFKFFTQFSAMEYALKEAKFLRLNDGEEIRDIPESKEQSARCTDAHADWRGFAEAFEEYVINQNMMTNTEKKRFDEAKSQLMGNPPRKYQRKLHTRETKWVEKSYQKPITLWDTVDCMKTVRNNLFHGNKYPFGDERDRLLIEACMSLLNLFIAGSRRARVIDIDSTKPSLHKISLVYGMVLVADE